MREKDPPNPPTKEILTAMVRIAEHRKDTDVKALTRELERLEEEAILLKAKWVQATRDLRRLRGNPASYPGQLRIYDDKLEPTIGSHACDVLKDLQRLSNELGQPLTIRFSGRRCSARPGDAVAEWHEDDVREDG